LVEELKEIDITNLEYNINEGRIGNILKNKLSKFLLGSFSGIGMLDQAVSIILSLEIDLVKKEYALEDTIANIEKEIKETSDNDRKLALQNEKVAKIREFEAFNKAQELKIKKSKNVAKKLVDDNHRRREYLEGCYAENALALAEVEYDLAKAHSEDQSKLSKYADKVKTASAEVDALAKEMEEEVDSANKRKSNLDDFSINPEPEKKLLTKKRGGDIIKRKNELEKEISDTKADMERKLNALEAKLKRSDKPLSPRYLENNKLDIIEMAATLDYKRNLLATLSSLGKSVVGIDKNLDNKDAVSNALSKVNANANTAKSASGPLSKELKNKLSLVGINKSGKLTLDTIEQIRKKLNL
jgi:hypothetical protein